MILIRLFGTWYRSDLPRQLDNLQRALLLITARFSGPTCSLSSFQAPKTSMDSYPRHSVVHLTVKPAVNSTDPIHDWHIIASWYSCCCCCWSLSYSAVLRSRADSLRSHVILHEWIAFYSAFMNIHRSGVLTALAWLVPHETAAVSARSVYTMHYVTSCKRKVHACLAVTCHLHFCQTDR